MPGPGNGNEALEVLLGQAADDYARRLEEGEDPDIEEYARQCPDLADTIRQVFPALRTLRTGPAVEAGEQSWSDAGTQLEQLGDYHILREIGRGGMGVVYEAQQQSLRRRVALKVLPFAAVLDSRQLQRFKNEAQAAANLHHTHIVPVFALGCERGVHYYAMQYIEGQPLSGIISQLRQFTGREAGPAFTGGDRLGIERPGAVSSATVPRTSLRERPAQRPAATESPTSTTGNGTSVPASPASSQPTNVIRTLLSGGWEPPSGRPPASSHVTLDPPQVRADPKESAGTPGSTDSPAYSQAIARLGVQAAEALQYAHDHGVIHRDIKPSNLLLDADGHLWITDFGLALIQANPALTVPGDLLGTIRYMSPEQAFGGLVPIDGRTDVYSLGVTLYELLTLEPVFAGQDRQKLLHRIASEDPVGLRRLNRSVPRELEIIVLKAISKDPRERYATAQALADDLRRFLEDKPILARPPTPLDRAAKWARRHRSIVMASAVFLILAVVGLTASTIMVTSQRNIARTQQELAETNLRRARENVDSMLTWIEMQEFQNSPYLGRLKRDLLEQSLVFHICLLPQKRNDPVARQDVADSYLQIAGIYTQLGREGDARTAYTDAIRILDELARESPEKKSCERKLADAYLGLAGMLWPAKRLEEALRATQNAEAILIRLTKETGADPVDAASLCRCLNMHALVLRDSGHLEQSEATLQRAVGVADELRIKSPQEPHHRVELARTYRNLADVKLKMSKPDDAVHFVSRATSLQEELVAAFPDAPAYATELAGTRHWWSEALKLSAPASQLPRAASTSPSERPGPAQAEAPPASPVSVARAWESLNGALRRMGPSPEGLDAYHQAVASQEALLVKNSSSEELKVALIELHLQQGKTMLTGWHLDQAADAYQSAMELAARYLLEGPEDANFRTGLANSLSGLRQVRERLPLADIVGPTKHSAEGVFLAMERAKRLDPKLLLNSDPILLLILSDFLTIGGEAPRAVPLIEQSIKAGGSTPCFNKALGIALLSCGRKEEATQAFQRAIKPGEGASTPPLNLTDPDVMTAAHFLGLLSADDFVKRWRNQAMCIGQMAPLPWFYVGLRHELEGRPEEARRAYQQAVQAGSVPNPHMTAAFARYRLKRMAGPTATAPAR